MAIKHFPYIFTAVTTLPISLYTVYLHYIPKQVQGKSVGSEHDILSTGVIPTFLEYAGNHIKEFKRKKNQCKIFSSSKISLNNTQILPALCE